MLPAALFEDDAGDIPLVQALHDRDHDIALGIVQAARPDGVEPVHGGLADRLALGVLSAVGIVEDQPRAALAGRRAADAGRDPVAVPVGLEALLGVLVACEAEQVPPALLIPLALDQAAGGEVVADRERAAV